MKEKQGGSPIKTGLVEVAADQLPMNGHSLDDMEGGLGETQTFCNI